MPGSAKEAFIERTILLLGHDWGDTADIIAQTNQSIATHLATFKGVKVFSSVLCDIDQLSADTHKNAVKAHVSLVAPSEASGLSLAERIRAFNQEPLSLFPNLPRHIPEVTHIIAHSPFTAEAALRLKQELYPACKVVLMYHVIPQDVRTLGDNLPFEVPTDSHLVRLAEEADVVYSVSEKLYWYYSAKFRNRAKADVDHRVFVPQCQEAIFKVNRTQPVAEKSPIILALAYSNNGLECDGIDIAACAVNKLALSSVSGSNTRPVPTLVIGCRLQSQLENLRQYISPFLTCPDLKFECHVHKDVSHLAADLAECALCVVPCRTEPYGSIGRLALSAGTPTLLAEHCNLSSLLERLSPEPERLLVQVTGSTNGVRQDASVWRDRMLDVLNDLGGAQRRANLLRDMVRRDERSRETHDNMTTYCLGGIRMRHEVTRLSFHIGGHDETREAPLLTKINTFLSDTLRLCWRLKHHPLTKKEDVREIFTAAELPLDQLTKKVINKIEEKDRRIVGYDDKSGSFFVYCPSPDSLSDLWAMCDVINHALSRGIFKQGDGNRVLREFEVKSTKLRTIISGPEFLKYKYALVKNGRPKTAAF